MIKNKKSATHIKYTPEAISDMRQILPSAIKLTPMHWEANGRYYSCLTAIRYPTHVDDLTLTRLSQESGVTVVMDIEHQQRGDAITSVERSINELYARGDINSKASETLSDSYEIHDMTSLHQELRRGNEYIVDVTLRFYLSSDSEEELGRSVKLFQKRLEQEYGIHLIVQEFEMADALRALSWKSNTAKQPMPVFGTLARQYPFSHQNYIDDYGIYFGHTSTGGKIVLDTFKESPTRKSYDFLMMGLKGSGKSATLKAMEQDMVALGHRVMVLDVEGEQIKLAKALGGVVISPDGKSAAINPLELRPRGLSDIEGGSDYASEISRVESFFYQYKPSMTERTADLLKDCLEIMYKGHGITPQTKLSELDSTDYPLMSDLLSVIRDKLYSRFDSDGQYSEVKLGLSDKQVDSLEELETSVKQLAEGSYAGIFNRHSTIDLLGSDFIVFDVSAIMNMEERVCNAQLFSILMIMWQEVYRNRERNKGVENYWDRVFSIAVIDEAHRFLNPNNPHGLQFIERMTRQSRKYDAAIWFASQSPRDFVPSGNSDQLDKIKNIFSLVQYKVVLQMDQTNLDLLAELMPQFTESELEQTVNFTRGEMLLSIGAGEKFHCSRYIPEEDFAIFSGGREGYKEADTENE